MRALTRLSLIAALVAVAGCDDDRRGGVPTMPIEIGPDALSAYVVVSNPDAPLGTEVQVSVRALRGRNVGPIGSFTIRLGYDSLGVSYVKSATSAHGLVMANGASRGLLVAAGASAEGFKDDELLNATFTVSAAGGLKSLALTVNELNSLAFEDQTKLMSVMKGIYRAPAGK
jgi:hypothetical protein